MEPTELQAWLRLVLTPQVGPATARRLLATFGLPQQIFGANPAALSKVVTPSQLEALRREPPQLAGLLASTGEWLAREPSRRRIWTLADADYPQALLQIEDPPLMLHACGACLENAGALSWPDAIGVVGSRNPTPAGAINARQFSRSFAQAGWCVISGLALGIDAAAHEGALEGAAPGSLATFAVVGTGLDRVYPRQHHELAHRIAQQGLLLSEYPLGTPPLAENFPRRNRMIAALSRGTLVVEAALQSGSLITARLAVEQGKDVFAIPGSIHSPQSRGCHALIKQGAKLVETAEDVLEELSGSPVTAAPAPELVPPTHTRDAERVLEAAGFDPVSLDALSSRTGLSTAALQACLLELELEGSIARLPGGRFQRISSA